jgi:hypothetical protein
MADKIYTAATKIHYHGLPGWWSLESEQKNMSMSPVGLGPDSDCTGEEEQQL